MVTLKYLKDVAKRKNIRGYSKLRKEDLKTLLRNRLPRMVNEEIMGSGATRRLLDDDIPESTTTSTNTICSLTKKEGVTQKLRGVTQELRRWLDWLTKFVPEPVKRPINSAFDTFKKKVMSLFPKQQLKFEESKKSALKGFTTHHTTKAPKNQTFDPKMFLSVVKEIALEKFKPQTKVRLVLKARMEKVSPTGGSSIVEVRNFQSKTAIVLESTNLNELWIEMVEQILENISVFKMNGSGWTFHSIVSLDIHTDSH